jgi:hypothetical protein
MKALLTRNIPTTNNPSEARPTKTAAMWNAQKSRVHIAVCGPSVTYGAS